MDNRLQRIYHTASRLFINQGYSRTQVKDIAKATGISVGSIYDLFTGKYAILLFLLKRALDQDYPGQEVELPITETHFIGLQEEIQAFFNGNNDRFAMHLTQKTGEYPFEQMLSDAFDTISQYGVGCLLFEKNPDDCGRMTAHYVQYQQKFFQTFLSYVLWYVQEGSLRQLAYPKLSANLMIETISWWGMNIQYDAFEENSEIPLEVNKAVCLDALVHGFQI